MAEAHQFKDVIGASVYAMQSGALTDQHLITALRFQVPTLINRDPDDYRTTREFVFEDQGITFSVACGECRDRTVWWGVMAIGPDINPPMNYPEVVRTVGIATIEKACIEGDFD